MKGMDWFILASMLTYFLFFLIAIFICFKRARLWVIENLTNYRGEVNIREAERARIARNNEF